MKTNTAQKASQTQNFDMAGFQDNLIVVLEVLDKNIEHQKVKIEKNKKKRYQDTQIEQFNHSLDNYEAVKMLAFASKIPSLSSAMKEVAPAFNDMEAGLRLYSYKDRQKPEACVAALLTTFKEHGFEKHHRGVFPQTRPEYTVYSL